MPKSAIASGLIDSILNAEDIPAELLNFITHSNILQNGKKEELFLKEEGLKKILHVVKKKTGIDFSDYKSPTLNRRIIRRMSVTKTKTVEEYLNYIHEYEYEAEVLHKEFLIGVTKFFRDPEAFTFIKEEVVPKIFNLHKRQ